MNSAQDLIQQIQQLIEKAYAATEPGCAVIVVRDGEVLLRTGRGMASFELGVPIEPDMVFRIASITKQFTAVSILMLTEQGKLTLDDPITRFFPDYPTQGHHITVRHLLNHTSGIKSYTNMPEWFPRVRQDFSVTEIIDFFKEQPMEFAPGEKMSYCNSGYILLGAIIEQVSEQSYADFLQQHIFTPLGMSQSGYDEAEAVIPKRVAGYVPDGDGYKNAPYLSMTQPFAAGALISTVDDLARWDAALYTEQLLSQETLQQAFVKTELKDGSLSDYGLGWQLSSYKGHPIAEHSGGIPGFTSYGLRLPDDRVYVAVLSNSMRHGAAELAARIAALVIGEPLIDPTPIELEPSAWQPFVGSYQAESGEVWRVAEENGRLIIQLGQSPPAELIPFTPNAFFAKDMPILHFHFEDNGATINLHYRTELDNSARRIEEESV
ncbi:MAG: serine hydrolase domain-containing protein [Chloroflexota bacterium]